MTTFSSAARPRVVVSRSPAARAGAASTIEPRPAIAADVPLGDLIDRSQAQVVVLRRALEEAMNVERAAAGQAEQLHQRLEQGRRFAAEFDQRLSAASKAAGVLEAAAHTLRGLEHLIAQMRELQSGADQRFALAIERAREDSEAALAAKFEESLHRAQGAVDRYEERFQEQERRFTARLEALESRVSESAGNVDNAHARVAQHIADAWTGIERRLKSEHDSLLSQLDRAAASSQARVSLILDSASERVSIMESQGQRLSVDIAQRVDGMCDQAARVLGMDPRTPHLTPIAGVSSSSLLGALEHAREALKNSDAAAIRLSALLGRADESHARVTAATQLAQGVAFDREEDAARIRRTIDQGLEKLTGYEASLSTATEQHAKALAEMTQVRDALSTAREDLERMASAAQYHADTVRENESRLSTARAQADLSAETARVRAEALDRAMQQVTLQAEALVGLAKDVGTLLGQAEAMKSQLANGESGESDTAAQAA
jgi:chromosome segregation ATPase